MSITTRSALGIAAALFAFGSACDDESNENPAANDVGQTKTTQPRSQPPQPLRH